MEGRGPSARAEDDRIIDIDYCKNASAIYHLRAIDDIVIREWNEDGTLEATVILGRFAKGVRRKGLRHPALKRSRTGSWPTAERFPTRMPSGDRGVFNRFPKRELFYADVRA
jgi:hypothetical protein